MTLLVFLTLIVAATISPASAETTMRVLMQSDSSWLLPTSPYYITYMYTCGAW